MEKCMRTFREDELKEIFRITGDRKIKLTQADYFKDRDDVFIVLDVGKWDIYECGLVKKCGDDEYIVLTFYPTGLHDDDIYDAVEEINSCVEKLLEVMERE